MVTSEVSVVPSKQWWLVSSFNSCWLLNMAPIRLHDHPNRTSAPGGIPNRCSERPVHVVRSTRAARSQRTVRRIGVLPFRCSCDCWLGSSGRTRSGIVRFQFHIRSAGRLLEGTIRERFQFRHHFCSHLHAADADLRSFKGTGYIIKALFDRDLRDAPFSFQTAKNRWTGVGIKRIFFRRYFPRAPTPYHLRLDPTHPP